jgi:UDP-glucose 4-epimerase
MRVLITGATGFIGRALLRAAPPEWDVVAVARDGRPAAWSGAEPAMWVQADLREAGFERRLPRHVDAVAHLAQARTQSAFPDNARELFDLNLLATARLLEYARAGADRFVLASTGTVYRQSTEPLSEDAPIDCTSFYAASKRSAELIVRPYSELFSCNVLRIFTVYGDGQEDRLISRLVARVRAGQPVTVQGRRGLLLSPVHVDDVAAALVATIGGETLGGPFEITNVGGPDALGIREVTEILGRVMGREPRFESAGTQEPGGFVADIAKLTRMLPIAPPRAFETGATQSFSASVLLREGA